MFNLFRFKNNAKNNKELNKDILCGVSIELDYDGKISLRYFWPKFDTENKKFISDISKDFGCLLYMINAGLLEKEMINTLMNPIDPNNPLDLEFGNESLKNWLWYVSSKNNTDPIVSPSNVFGKYTDAKSI